MKGLRPARAVIALVSWLVPSSGRDRWRREWEAELIQAFRRGVPVRRLLRRTLLAPADALVFRRYADRIDRARGQAPQDLSPGGKTMEALLQDLRYALRSFRRRPSLTAVVLVTLAVGIAGSTTIFSLLHNVALAPLPYTEQDRIVQVWPMRSQGLSKLVLERLRKEAQSYEDLAAWNEGSFKWRVDGRAEMLEGPQVSAGYFEVLDLDTHLGRKMEPADERRGEPVVWLSYELWQKRFGGDPEVLGRVMDLEGVPRTIVGVLEPGFEHLQSRVDVLVPHLVEADTFDYDANYMDVIGRLAPGVTVEQADAELLTLARRWMRERGRTEEWIRGVSVIPLHEFVVGEVRPTLFLLCGAVGFMLLIVVANVANLLLARTLSRERELSLRFALGASRGRIGRQLVSEATLLAAGGGLLGALLGLLALEGLRPILPAEMPRLDSIGLGSGVAPQVLLFAVALTLVTGLLVGLLPALSVARRDMRGALSASGKGAGVQRSRRRLRSALVVAEVALAVVLLAGAGLLMRSFWRTLQVAPGFEAAGRIHFTVHPGKEEWSSAQEVDAYYAALRDRLAALPGVEQAAELHAVPLVNTGWVMGTFPTDEPPEQGKPPYFSRWRPVGPEYFQTAGIDLIAGRGFTSADRAGAEPVVILNQTTARQFFGDEDPLGRLVRITFEGEGSFRVVGVVRDVKILGLRQPAPLTVYRPYSQASARFQQMEWFQRTFLLHAPVALESLAGAVRAVVREHDPMANVTQLEPMEEAVAASLAGNRVVMWIVAAFAGLALLLGAVGIYGVMDYAVGERKGEMGIRLALGAARRSVTGLVVTDGLRLVALGLTLGAGLALMLTRYLGSQLFEVSARDPWTLAAVALVLTAAALLAAYLPARRAGRVDPMEVLRGE